jgi:tripartite ATP-independent transporter DctP family solute receptor
MMRWVRLGPLALLLSAMLVNYGGTFSSAEPGVYVIRFAMATNRDEVTSQSQIIFMKQVESLSHGQLRVQLFFGEQLGSTQAQFDQVRDGTLQMAQGVTDWLAKYFAPIQVFSLPMMFPDYASAHKAVDGPVAKEVGDALLKRAGFRILNWENIGAKAYFNRKHPINSLQDFTGLKMRVIPSPIAVATAQAFGVEPVTVDYKEWYTAIQQGVVDGGDAPLTSIYSTKVYEVARYASVTNHVVGFSPTVVNEAFFSSLPQQLQNIILEAAKGAENSEWSALSKNDATIMDDMVKRGVKFNSLSAGGREELRAAAKPVWNQFKQKLGPDAARWIDQLSAGR